MWFEDVMMWVCGLICAAAVALLIFVGWVIWTDSQRPTFELTRDDWTCSKTEQRRQLIWTGKVMVPTIRNVCVEYRRNAG